MNREYINICNHVQSYTNGKCVGLNHNLIRKRQNSLKDYFRSFIFYMCTSTCYYYNTFKKKQKQKQKKNDRTKNQTNKQTKTKLKTDQKQTKEIKDSPQKN